MIFDLVDRVIKGEELSKKEAEVLIHRDLYEVLFCANKIREHFKGNKVFTCSIINAKSGLCSEDCAFCAQSKYHNTHIQVYPLLSISELVKEGEKMAENGALRFSFVTSGKKLSKREIDTICEAAHTLTQQTGLKICASLGMLDEDYALSLKQAGVIRYHHNLETSRSFFKNICTTHEYDDDLNTIDVAKGVGLEVCSGGIVGLGENFYQRIELALLLRELDVDSIPINFLHPIKGTKLEHMKLIPPKDALLTISIFRFLNPDKDITICGGRELCLRDLQSWIFFAGASGVMIGNYLTTRGREIKDDLRMIEDIGLEIGIE